MKRTILLFSIFAFANLFTACSNDNPLDAIEPSLNEVNEAIAETKNQEYQAHLERCQNNYYNAYGVLVEYEPNCPLPQSSSSSYSHYDYYSSSSSYYYYSSSSSAKSYLTTAKTMKFTMTYYYQRSSNWDGLGDTGDPRISFSVNFYDQYGTLLKNSGTGTLLEKDDCSIWRGTSSTTLTAPINTYKIKVIPKVIDADGWSNDDDYSSGYSYSKEEVGYLEDYEIVEQNDSHNSDADVNWEWYLY